MQLCYSKIKLDTGFKRLYQKEEVTKTERANILSVRKQSLKKSFVTFLKEKVLKLSSLNIECKTFHLPKNVLWPIQFYQQISTKS